MIQSTCLLSRLPGEAPFAVPAYPIADPASEASGGRVAGHLRSQRTFRAILFTDIVDSIQMTARLGDVRALEMVRAHDALVRDALQDAGGREVKHTGDGIMASFNDVISAVDCAGAIQQAFNEYNHRTCEPLRVRIGIHAGDALEIGDDLFGLAVQTAARLCQAAPASGILISGEVRRALPVGIELANLGVRALKGFQNPVPVFEVLWRKQRDSSDVRWQPQRVRGRFAACDIAPCGTAAP